MSNIRKTVLGLLGYDVGVPDGVAGPKTADAIRAFEPDYLVCPPLPSDPSQPGS